MAGYGYEPCAVVSPETAAFYGMDECGMFGGFRIIYAQQIAVEPCRPELKHGPRGKYDWQNPRSKRR